ncbi:arylformamidase [Devosia subaequoris]|uniref:Arylformamidase n=1 Tax=Devosia subaequoris TaxID=395930 RepID=A0A7W6IQJ7_9HYPH|nr:alpha/beta hydrolase [Devosia subaequoris]MBB4053958.1 arylformamidase [Devosia subaequoris]MCP1211462.1 alpha/beta hydrolase [Devosia subaequoris]
MTNAARIWEGLSQEEHERQYNPQKACPNFDEYRALREPANEQALKELMLHADIAYGDHKLRTLDIYPALGEGARPVHIYLHGGYWRAQDKVNYAFIAGMLVQHGITTVVMNYELCPNSSLDEVADSALAGVEWVCRNIAGHGGDEKMISLSGHSAGAHLVAEVLATDWKARGIDPSCFVGAVAVSGIFDPAPAALTTVNTQLNLTPETIANRNVETRTPLVKCPVAVMVGGDEPWQWIDQSFRYSHHLHRHGNQPEVQVLPNYNHFNILLPFMQPESAIGSAMLRLARPRR